LEIEMMATTEKQNFNLNVAGIGGFTRSGSTEEQAAADAALLMAAGVVGELGGTFAADGHSGTGTAGAWSYGTAEVHGVSIRLAASGGGVVQVNRHPFGPDSEVILTARQVKAAILAIAPTAKSDLSYRAVDDMFTVFYPDSKAGENAWRTMNATEGSEGGKVLTRYAGSVIEQLRAAGYTVAQAPPVTETDDELLAALGIPESSEEHANNDELIATIEATASTAWSSLLDEPKVDTDFLSERPAIVDEAGLLKDFE
jgi:hypothetical protein